MKGKIIVIEGVDGSGKETQTNLLLEKLQKRGFNVKKQSFPNYESLSSGPVKMYLNGDLGTDVNYIDPYATSLLFTADRICTMQQYKKFLQSGGILILDRYMESNFIHQGSKLETEQEKTNFENILKTIEYKFAKIPKPDCIFFLDVPPAFSVGLRKKRTVNKNGEKTDIHEQNLHYLKNSYLHGLSVAKRNNWNIIHCINQNQLQSIDEINSKIITKLEELAIIPSLDKQQ